MSNFVQIERESLEQDILKLIRDFEQMTGYNVTRIEVETTRLWPLNERISKVKLTVVEPPDDPVMRDN